MTAPSRAEALRLFHTYYDRHWPRWRTELSRTMSPDGRNWEEIRLSLDPEDESRLIRVLFDLGGKVGERVEEWATGIRDTS